MDRRDIIGGQQFLSSFNTEGRIHITFDGSFSGTAAIIAALRALPEHYAYFSLASKENLLLPPRSLILY